MLMGHYVAPEDSAVPMEHLSFLTGFIVIPKGLLYPSRVLPAPIGDLILHSGFLALLDGGGNDRPGSRAKLPCFFWGGEDVWLLLREKART